MLFWDDGSRRGEVYDLWQRNFQDPVPYADFYFEEYYGRNRVLLHKDDEEGLINGSIHLNPYSLNVRGNVFAASYIVGVATDEAYRRQGIMRKMLHETFSRLREEGAPFTYLMPADEAYYLPFGFRFGMSQTEQEITCLPAREELRFHFKDQLSREEMEKAVRVEQEEKEKLFAVFTEVDRDYLDRLEKEMASDYGRMLYVFEGRPGGEDPDRSDEVYVGRFCVAAEYDTLLINRIFCRRDCRKDFLRDILRYHEDTYHYGNYQVVLDQSWDDLIQPAGPQGHVRLLVPHRKKKIMFRILNLEKMGDYLLTDLSKTGGSRSRTDKEEMKTAKEAETAEAAKETETAETAKEAEGDALPAGGRLYVQDPAFPALEGSYEICSRAEGRVSIQRIDDSRTIEGDDRQDWGRIEIGPLTSLLFGDLTLEEMEEEEVSGLTEAGRDFLASLVPLGPSCIMEIV